MGTHTCPLQFALRLLLQERGVLLQGRAPSLLVSRNVACGRDGPIAASLSGSAARPLPARCMPMLGELAAGNATRKIAGSLHSVAFAPAFCCAPRSCIPLIAESTRVFRPCAGGEVGGAARGGHLPRSRPRREKGRPLRAVPSRERGRIVTMVDDCVGGVKGAGLHPIRHRQIFPWQRVSTSAAYGTRTRRQAGCLARVHLHLTQGGIVTFPCSSVSDLLSMASAPGADWTVAGCAGLLRGLCVLGTPHICLRLSSRSRIPVTL